MSGLKLTIRFMLLIALVFNSPLHQASASHDPINNNLKQVEATIVCEWPAEVLWIARNSLGEELDIDNLIFCEGEYIEVEAFGYSVNGGIPPTLSVSDDYDFYWDGEIQKMGSRQVRIKLDSNHDNVLKIHYTLKVDGESCSDSKEIEFHTMPAIAGTIHWSFGDILQVETEIGSTCFQWGKIVDNTEVVLENETEISIDASQGSMSPFIDEIVDCKPVPKNIFDDIYFVQLYDCALGLGSCNQKLYFTPENFAYTTTPEDQEIDLPIEAILFPNPGNGLFYIDSDQIDLSHNITIDILDPSGQVIISKMEYCKKTPIDIRTYPNGTYHILMRSGNTIQQKGYIKN